MMETHSSVANQQLEKSPAGPSRTEAAWAYGLLALGLLFAAFVRYRLAEFPLERDEGEYAYAGQLILRGIPPYQLAYNMKLPGTYLAYAAIMAVFGETTVGIHLGVLVVNLLSILLLFRLTRSLLDPISAGIAAIAYAILTTSPSVLGMAGHATHFVTLFGLGGACALWNYVRTQRGTWAFASGLLLGIAFLMKQHGVFLIAFGFFYLPWLRFGPARDAKFRLLVAWPLYLLGAGLPYLLCAVWLWHAGVWQKFIYWTVEYAAHYVQQVSYDLAVLQFWESSLGVIGRNWMIWLLAFAGLWEIFWGGSARSRARSFLAFYFIGSLACIFPGLLFRQHYFIPILPAVAICAGHAARSLWSQDSSVWWWGLLRRWWHAGESPRDSEPSLPTSELGHTVQHPLIPRWAALTIVVVLFASTIWFQSSSFFFWSPQQACRVIYSINPFVECAVVGRYLEQHTTPDQTIAVLGSEPELYFYANRKAGTGYMYMYPLMEDQPLAREMQAEMIKEIEQARPEFLVFVNVAVSWLRRNDEDLLINWAKNYVPAHYEQVGMVDIIYLHEAEYRWDSDAIGAKPRRPNSLQVYRRQTAPEE